MPNHTPAPWLYRPKEHDDWGMIRGGPEGFPLAKALGARMADEDELNEHRRNGTDPYEADALLIAAAPDLLEALQAAIGALEFNHDYEVDNGDDDSAQFSLEALNQAKAAINKATGQQ